MKVHHQREFDAALLSGEAIEVVSGVISITEGAPVITQSGGENDLS